MTHSIGTPHGLGYVYNAKLKRKGLGTVKGHTNPNKRHVHDTGDTRMGERYRGQGGTLVDLLLALCAPCQVCGAAAGEACTVSANGSVQVHAEGKRTEHLTATLGKHKLGQ
jgi:hypothetical protein